MGENGTMSMYKKIILVVCIFSCALSNAAFQLAYQQAVVEELIFKLSENNRPLHIFFVVGHFPSPSQTFILNMITGLIDNGHKVSIFSFHKDSFIGAHPNIEKYKLLDRVIYEEFPEKMPECDIVFCQFGYLGKKIVHKEILREWLKKRKVVVCLRGSDLSAHLKEDPRMYRELFAQGHLFLPVCDYFKKKLISLGCDPHKIDVHHSAIDCTKFFFKERKKPKKGIINLVSVCRLVEKKGLDYAIKAIAAVVRKYKNIHYTIVGDGPMQEELKRLIRKLKLKKKVTLYGWGTQEQVVTILNDSHIFLLPSITSADGNEEGIPNALKEAMAMGLLSVGTWHAGTPELIDNGVSGFLVPEKNSTELAKKILHIIEHPEIWKSVGAAGRKKVEDEFETKQSIQKLEKLFYKLLG